jgi:hypothetical protein
MGTFIQGVPGFHLFIITIYHSLNNGIIIEYLANLNFLYEFEMRQFSTKESEASVAPVTVAEYSQDVLKMYLKLYKL